MSKTSNMRNATFSVTPCVSCNLSAPGDDACVRFYLYEPNIALGCAQGEPECVFDIIGVVYIYKNQMCFEDA